jgi:hypothetical protein
MVAINVVNDHLFLSAGKQPSEGQNQLFFMMPDKITASKNATRLLSANKCRSFTNWM